MENTFTDHQQYCDIACKYAGILGSTLAVIENMFADRTTHTFENMTEIELENGTLTCCFKNDKCNQIHFFTHDE